MKKKLFFNAYKDDDDMRISMREIVFHGTEQNPKMSTERQHFS